MKALKLLPLAALLALGACDQLKQEDVALETQAQKISYLLGMDNGKNIQSVGVEIDTAAFQQGFTAGIEGADQKANNFRWELMFLYSDLVVC